MVEAMRAAMRECGLDTREFDQQIQRSPFQDGRIPEGKERETVLGFIKDIIDVTTMSTPDLIKLRDQLKAEITNRARNN